MLTRFIDGGKENLVLSWSHFPFRMAAMTSCNGVPFNASCNVFHGVIKENEL